MCAKQISDSGGFTRYTKVSGRHSKLSADVKKPIFPHDKSGLKKKPKHKKIFLRGYVLFGSSMNLVIIILCLLKIPFCGEGEGLIPCWSVALNPEGDNKISFLHI